MGFKLTFLLLAVIFLAMYFAPEGPRRATQPSEPIVAAPAPQPDTPPLDDQVTQAEPQPSLLDPAPAPGADEADDLLSDDASQSNDGAVTLPGLDFGATGGDAADALSLSESVRNRGAEAAQNATDDLLQGLLNETPAGEQDGAPVLGDVQPTSPNPAPVTRRALVTATSVNLRAGPSTSDAVVGRVNFGVELDLTAPFRDGWASVVHPDTGQEVFMASRFLQIQP
ncbi:SH3 domain-containing protein [Meridianimarinicoccus aquatilis]|uniref:SH3 domain-containing protein n=1 Tax=Meridianimarinicoccus aquatilis TaxID=2552766 RepID=A0A4R6B1T1_9RHOB|nr:SH3 domain-containing protein [Fluviibacterium aquatile]QIE41295.1 hypothetical protein G5B39_04595 [Rhodobacteraceae bacterium SC52]TDL90637.1 hypothetical protein E2L05_04980 [Fluviibacterium aquatile]